MSLGLKDGIKNLFLVPFFAFSVTTWAGNQPTQPGVFRKLINGCVEALGIKAPPPKPVAAAKRTVSPDPIIERIRKEIEQERLHREQLANYVSSLRPGDKIKFPDGESFEFIQLLGEGQENYALEIRYQAGSAVLRLPKGMQRNDRKEPSYRIVQDTLLGAEELKRQKVRIPKIYKTSIPYYMIMEKIDVQFTLNDLIEGKVELNPELRTRLKTSLAAFFAHTAMFCKIGDFHPGQLGFNGQEWILLDWHSGHSLFDPSKTAVHQSNIIEQLKWSYLETSDKSFKGVHFDEELAREFILDNEAVIEKARLE